MIYMISTVFLHFCFEHSQNIKLDGENIISHGQYKKTILNGITSQSGEHVSVLYYHSPCNFKARSQQMSATQKMQPTCIQKLILERLR
jgi:hypothetical protein